MLNVKNSNTPPSYSNNKPMLPNMSEALALVRVGRLHDASNLLMGSTTSKAVAGNDTHHLQPVLQPDLSGTVQAVRGLTSIGDVLRKLDGSLGRTFKSSATKSAARATSERRSGADTPTTTAPGRFERVAFTHNGESHPYLLYTPKTAAPACGRPLVLMLHGCTQDARDFAMGTHMNTTAESSGALVLYPTQTQSANANACWNWFKPEDQQAGTGEPALLLAMLKHAMTCQAVDLKGVFVAGLSAGGAMAAILAQQHPTMFAAVGVHSGLPPGAATNMMGALSAMKNGAKGFKPSHPKGGGRPVPMIVMHGDADQTVHRRNSEQLMHSATASLRNTLQTQEQGSSSDGQRYTRTCVLEASGSDRLLAEHWLLHGAGHAWSGGDARGSHASARGVDASAEMLRFFLAQTG